MLSQACRACSGAWPQADDRVTDCGTSVLYLFEDQFFPGWSVLVLKKHATELFELSGEERRDLMDEVSCVAQALAIVFKPLKINYELLGNQMPHIHWHVIPRLSSDPCPREPVWNHRHEPVPLTPEERGQRIKAIRQELLKIRAAR